MYCKQISLSCFWIVHHNLCTEDEGLGPMNEKKVENIHTKPRGKGQCSPEQTCPEVPLVLYRFLILVDVYLSLWTNWLNRKQTTNHCPTKFLAYIYLFHILPFFSVFFWLFFFNCHSGNCGYCWHLKFLTGMKFSHCVSTLFGDFSHFCVNTGIRFNTSSLLIFFILSSCLKCNRFVVQLTYCAWNCHASVCLREGRRVGGATAPVGPNVTN